MNLLELLRSLDPSFFAIEEAPLLQNGETVAWESVFLNKHRDVIGGAVATDRALCRQIGLAETLERLLVSQLRKKGDQDKSLMLSLFPTSCGFALGFEPAGARRRSLFEGLERWVWSQWIDSGFRLDSVSVDSRHLSPMAQYYRSLFDEVLFFRKSFEFPYLNDGPVQIGITIGLKKQGAFAGSRVDVKDADVWSHALSESGRHFLRFQKLKKDSKFDLVDARLAYFGAHAESALAQIRSARKDDWPTPKTLISKEVERLPQGISLYRSLFQDYIGWHEGNADRFVY